MPRRPGFEPGFGEITWPPPADIVSAAAAGDSSALTVLLTDGYPRLIAFYLGVGLDRHSAEELAAETCEAIVTGLRRIRAPQAFEAWFWSVARNRLRSLFRRRKTTRPTDAMISPSSPEEVSVERDEHRRIRAAMSHLSLKDRQLLWLREVEGLEYSDISTRLGATEGAIRVACHRARRRLEAIYMSGDQG